ncbi:MAG TPA: ParB/RepB/Spo0J family partition protein [Solirubrobacteraceae bacterium]|nr:ParB/RepB/Spo0J family partition protein [Solirubrobacteraceae bacterium]
MTTTAPATELRLALDEIRVRENVRELDIEHVDNLAQSIALRGLLVPLIVRPVDGAYELVAGYHRIAACRKLALPDAPVVVREHEGSSADSAAENITSCRRRHDVIYADPLVMPTSPRTSCAAAVSAAVRSA